MKFRRDINILKKWYYVKQNFGKAKPIIQKQTKQKNELTKIPLDIKEHFDYYWVNTG